MSNEDDDFIKSEFEWALKDPTEEKLRGLGEIVDTITKRLVEAITELQSDMYELQTAVQSMESKLNSLSSRGVSAAEATASPAASVASGPSEPIAKAPTPKPAPTAGPGGMMSELKQLLAARRRKAEGGGEE
ncbi:hypothetical protein EU538_01760 [Candidatus Thorarchaeota archaeon]|jgi:hypothetical protein|nr:MAG: hypothetical protein EU538_01760 [Candidatus Thorarchaeota archaeon]